MNKHCLFLLILIGVLLSITCVNAEHTTLTVDTYDETFTITHSNGKSNTYDYNSQEIKISSQSSDDDLYNYKKSEFIYGPVKIKKPVYAYKKVKKYKWKYYKTRWFTKKIVTHRIRNGKLITYHTAYDKIDELKDKNAKVIKTVTSKDKTTVYLKQPVKYYKKVKTYKKKRYVKKYKTVTAKRWHDTWVSKRGPFNDIAMGYASSGGSSSGASSGSSSSSGSGSGASSGGSSSAPSTITG